MKRSDINGLTKKEEIIWEQLMIKDLSHSLTEEEKIKYNKLTEKRNGPLDKLEEEKCKKLSAGIAELRKIIDSGKI